MSGLHRRARAAAAVVLAAGLLLAWPGFATAQSAAAPAAAMAMEHADMAGMAAHDGHDADASTQDATAPRADYSDGIGHDTAAGMDMLDRPVGALLIDQLEVTHGQDGDGQAWVAQGWYGGDVDKLWLRTEGEGRRGQIDDGQIEASWSRAIAPFWDAQFGVRQDMGEGPHRRWAAFGIRGLAPYWVALEAMAYLGPSGRSAARLRAEYELRFTQRLILQPDLEINLRDRNDPSRRVGYGGVDTRLGVRLRFEIRRSFAPYMGVLWTHGQGKTAGYARLDHEPLTDRQFVVGVRLRL